MFKELYKLYQLMEFFVINHHYKTIAVKNLVKRDEIWLANPANIGCEIIRLTLSSLEYIENDEEGNIFELIAEECYYDDLREEE